MHHSKIHAEPCWQESFYLNVLLDYCVFRGKCYEIMIVIARKGIIDFPLNDLRAGSQWKMAWLIY